MSDDGRREFLRVVQENASSPAGEFPEEEFFATLRKVFEGTGRRPHTILTSPAVVARARADAEALRVGAQAAYMGHRRLPWWRWVRRRKLAEAFMRKRVIADSLEAMFGRG